MKWWKKSLVAVSVLALLVSGLGCRAASITALAELADARRNENTANECSTINNVSGNGNTVINNNCSGDVEDQLAALTFDCDKAVGDSGGICFWEPPDRAYVLAAFHDGEFNTTFCSRSPCELDPHFSDPEENKRWEFVLLDENGQEITQRVPLILDS